MEAIAILLTVGSILEGDATEVLFDHFAIFGWIFPSQLTHCTGSLSRRQLAPLLGQLFNLLHVDTTGTGSGSADAVLLRTARSCVGTRLATFTTFTATRAVA